MKERIKVLRKRAGLTQIELADKLSISEQTVKRWEWGERIPRADDLNKLAEVFGITVDELINGPSQTELKINIIWEVSEEMENLAIRSNEFNVGIRGSDFLIWGALPQSMTPSEIADRVKLELEAMAAAARARNKVLNKAELI